MISDNAKRTMKYLLALASGTPCVHYNWILHSVEQQCILPYEKYILPSGLFKETGKVAYRDKEPYEKLPLEGARFDVFGSTEFRVCEEEWSTSSIEIWEPQVPKFQWKKLIIPPHLDQEKWVMILRDAGGQLVDSNTRSVKYILCDGNPQPYEIKTARDKKLPLLLPEWAIQTLISGKPVDPDDDRDEYVVGKK